MIRTGTIKAAVIALVLAGSAPLAHAGGGGAGGIGDTFLFECYLINGANPPHVLTIDDQFAPEGRTGVKVGKAKLLCTPAGATVTSNHEVRAGLSDADHIKCYESPAGKAPKVEVQVVDPFVTETVEVGLPRFVCVGAIKCPVGQLCPPQ
jgi:hypothetical protein